MKLKNTTGICQLVKERLEKSEEKKLCVVLSVASFLLVAAFVINLHYPKIDILRKHNFASSAFTTKGEPDPHAPPRSEDVMPVPARFTFGLEVPQGIYEVMLSFFYRCEPECTTLWLDIPTQNEAPARFVAEHPVFRELRWFHIEEAGLRLYQKNPAFKTVEAFIHTMPAVPVLVDGTLIQLNQWQQANVIPLEGAQTVGDARFVLTTYKQPLVRGEWKLFSQMFTTEGVVRSQNGVIPVEVIAKDHEGFQLYIQAESRV